MCPTITVGSFFRHERSTFSFICSTTSNLNNFKPQQLQPQKRVQNEKKKQNRRPQPRKHTKDPTLAPLFSALCDFFWSFLDCTRGSPLHLFRYFATQWMSKNCKRSPLLHFSALWHCSKISLKKFFGKFFMSPKGPPFNFLEFFATSWSFTKPKGSPF